MPKAAFQTMNKQASP